MIFNSQELADKAKEIGIKEPFRYSGTNNYYITQSLHQEDINNSCSYKPYSRDNGYVIVGMPYFTYEDAVKLCKELNRLKKELDAEWVAPLY